METAEVIKSPNCQHQGLAPRQESKNTGGNERVPCDVVNPWERLLIDLDQSDNEGRASHEGEALHCINGDGPSVVVEGECVVEEGYVHEEEEEGDECRKEDYEEHETNAGDKGKREDAIVLRPRREQTEHPN